MSFAKFLLKSRWQLAIKQKKKKNLILSRNLREPKCIHDIFSFY